MFNILLNRIINRFPLKIKSKNNRINYVFLSPGRGKTRVKSIIQFPLFILEKCLNLKLKIQNELFEVQL